MREARVAREKRAASTERRGKWQVKKGALPMVRVREPEGQGRRGEGESGGLAAWGSYFLSECKEKKVRKK
jgi:hypothetical protein